MTSPGGERGLRAVPPVSLGRALDVIEPVSTVGIGSLPHRSATDAASFVFRSYDTPSAPSLPRRSPAESAINQALAGTRGVTFGQYGALAIDSRRLDPAAPVVTDLGSDSFVGLNSFLRRAAQIDYRGPVKWHFVGPVSVGVALRRAGAEPDLAFEVALHVVREHMLAVSAAVAAALPHSPQLVVVNEPMLERDAVRALDIPLLATADLVSSAMASVEHTANVGVHCCRGVDLDILVEAGPHLVSMSTHPGLVDAAGVLGRFFDHGGWVLWGAVATEGPIGVTAKRSWQQLLDLWRGLDRRGVDLDLVRSRSLLAPQCGLGAHTPEVADRVCNSLREVSVLARASGTLVPN